MLILLFHLRVLSLRWLIKTHWYRKIDMLTPLCSENNFPRSWGHQFSCSILFMSWGLGVKDIIHHSCFRLGRCLLMWRWWLSAHLIVREDVIKNVPLSCEPRIISHSRKCWKTFQKDRKSSAQEPRRNPKLLGSVFLTRRNPLIVKLPYGKEQNSSDDCAHLIRCAGDCAQLLFY